MVNGSVVVWLLWAGVWANNGVTVPGIATQAECERLGMELAGRATNFRCVSYLAAQK